MISRTDIFFKAELANHNNELLEESIRRANAYAESGASGFFVPGLRDAQHIEKLCELSPLAVNVMVLPDMPSSKQLTKLGVSRISYGPGPYCQAMDALKEAGHRAFSIS